jgi:hypothetical protein
MTIGIVVVSFLDRRHHRIRPRHDEVGLELDELGGQSRQTLLPSLGEPPLESEILAFHVPELAQGIVERLDDVRDLLGRDGQDQSDPVDLPRRLRPGAERQRA